MPATRRIDIPPLVLFRRSDPMTNGDTRTAWKRRLGRLWSLPKRLTSDRHRPKTCVLLYHSLGDDPYSLPVHIFESQMQFLAENANVTSLRALLRGELADDRINCAITWDDGYESVHRRAFAILNKYKYPATLYVTTGLIGERDPLMSDRDKGVFPGLPMLTWEQLRELRDGMFDIGAHLVHHLDLTGLTPEHARAELTLSKRAVEQNVRRPCLDFAYPWGLANQRCAQWVREAGYRSASTTRHGFVSAHCEPMLLPRLTVDRTYDVSDFQALIRGDWNYLAIAHWARERLGLAGPASVA